MMNNDDKRYIVLVIYDITDNKRRTELVHCIEKYGLRVQLSAFECFLGVGQYQKLMKESSVIINEKQDSLRIYFLGDHTKVRTWGKVMEEVAEVIIY